MHMPVSRRHVLLAGASGDLHRQRPFAGPADPNVDRVSAPTLARIPVATLLNHSSGLPNWSGGELEIDFEPGLRWQYSGEAHLLLQAVLSAVLKEPVEALVSRLVFEPLGMRDSRMYLTDDIRSRVIAGVGWFGQRAHVEFTEPNAAASMYTTAADYARLLGALASRVDLMALTVADPIPVAAEHGATRFSMLN